MTPSKLKSVLKFYEQHLSGNEPIKCDTGKRFRDVCPLDEVPQDKVYNHLLWMCREAQTFLKPFVCSCHGQDHGPTKGGVEKAMRWLGFIQGCFFMLGDFSIDELRKHSTTEKM